MNQGRENPALQRALNCATHPVTLAAVCVLWLNAAVLQPHWPSWITGKAGDAAWMVLAPVLLASVLAWLVPARWSRQAQIVGWLAAAFTGAILVLVKTVPAANAGANEAFRARLGFPLKLALDPSDVLVLPALAVFGWLWTRPLPPRRRPTLPGLAALALTALALMADAAGPQDLGITCLRESANSLLAFRERNYPQEFGATRHEVVVYQSGDGGLTWRQLAAETYDPASPPTAAPNSSNAALLQFSQCAPHDSDWQLPDPAKAQVLYAFVGGKGIYRSDDAGQTLRKEADLTSLSVLDAHFYSATGNLLVAVGKAGVMVRGADGKWQPVSLDRTSAP
jgi:hypothetical protein